MAYPLSRNVAARIAGALDFTDIAGTIPAAQLATDAVETLKIKDSNVTAGKLATDAVETLKIKDENVTAGKLATDAVETLKIKDLNVTTAKLADDAVTAAKVADAAIDAAAKIVDGVITGAKLASGAGVAALLAAGLGASASYIKTTNGVQTLLALDAANDRAVVIVVTVDETFANGDTSQTTFKVGETDTDDKFAATTVFTGATAGQVFTLAGILTANKALLVTAVAAAGTGTGGISVTVLALDKAP